jgi:thioredoxin 1
VSENALIQVINSKDFKNSIQQGLVLVDFFAEWCGPCKMLSPVLEELAEEMKETVTIAKVDIDEAQEIAMQMQVTSVPTIVLFKEGVEVQRVVGLKDKNTLKQLITAA